MYFHLPFSFPFRASDIQHSSVYCKEDSLPFLQRRQLLYYFTSPKNKTPSAAFQKRNMSSNNSTSTSASQAIEEFLYTPHGLVTLAAVAVLLTSLVWLLGCCIYCFCKRRRQRSERGLTEANRDLFYLGVNDPANGTLTSGYNTGPAQAYSLNSLSTDNAIFHSSLDSILDES